MKDVRLGGLRRVCGAGGAVTVLDSLCMNLGLSVMDVHPSSNAALPECALKSVYLHAHDGTVLGRSWRVMRTGECRYWVVCGCVDV